MRAALLVLSAASSASDDWLAWPLSSSWV